MKGLRVLYVTDRWDGPYRYRCQQAAEGLRSEGVVANVAHIDAAGLEASIPRYGVLVLFRLPWSERIERVVEAARRAGVPLLFDIDDLIFDPGFARLMPFRRRYSAEEWARSYGRQMAGLRRTFDACDAFIGSTPELAEQAAALGKRAHVSPNVVPELYLSRGRFGPQLRRAVGVPPTIGYFSGSDTHDEDFASIAPALEHVLEEHPTARLLVVGYLDLAGRHPLLEQRVVRLPYMHWRDFAFAYAACHVTLAPLAAINAFTNCKSALKFFEAGAFSVPTIASPVREMTSAIRHGETGFLAASEREWSHAVSSALDPSISAELGSAARAAVLSAHSASAHRGRLRAILEQYAVAGAGRSPRRSPLEVPDENGPSRGLGAALRPGRAARDLARIVRAARRGVQPTLAQTEADCLLDAAIGSEEAARALTDSGVHIVTNGDMSEWRSNDQIGPTGGLPGEFRSKGADPHLVGPPGAVDPTRFRYLAIRLRVAASSPSARAQIFWRSDASAPFMEETSARFSVATDGLDRTYVVDLAEESVRHAWLRSGRVTHLRLDPMDRPGSFRIGAAVLVPESAALTGHSTPRAEDRGAPFDLDADAGGRWAGTGAALGRGGRVRATVLGDARLGRAKLAEWAAGKDLVVERLSAAEGGRLTAVLRGGRGEAGNGVDIVVPVYNARELVLRCVASVVEHARGDYRLIIVDDASTDPELVSALLAFATKHERVVLLRNPENLGFVGTANRGIHHAQGRDVLLLNSDTEVFAGFLEGLRECARSDARAGMVSPLSNNATICSVPEFCRDNALPSGMTRAEMADLVARSSERLRPELVTPHGFCLYLRADFLAAVGAFDEARFGRGFGEENDLGERAKAAGWRTLLADDVYVWHAGKASFGAEGRALEDRHAAVLARLHPAYHPAVARWVQANPLAPVHAIVRRHLARRSDRAAPAPLFILHASPFGPEPGGVEHCVRDLVRALALPRAVLAYPADGSLEAAEVLGGDLDNPLIYRFSLMDAPSRFCHEHAETVSAMAELLGLFRVGWVHVHHLMFLPLSIGRLLAERSLPYMVTAHDFYPACPSFNLLDVRTNTPCCPGSCGDRARTTGCQRALLAKFGERAPADPAAFAEQHRREFQALLAGAERVLFPSPSTERLTRAVLGLSGVDVEVLPHGYDGWTATRSTTDVSRPLRVALVGQICYAAKGADAYLRTIASTACANIEWHIFGRTDLFGFEQRLLALELGSRVVRHGAYDRDTIVSRMVRAGVDVGLMLPAWPETFSYILTELLAAGIPVVARRIGALEDRLAGAPFAVLVDGAEQAAREIERLERDRPALAKMAAAVVAPAGTASWADRHRVLYDECRASSPVAGDDGATDAEYRRLNEISVTTKVVDHRAAVVTQPAAAVVSAWWFRYAERAKPYAPEALRQAVRRRLARDGTKTVVRFSLPGPRARLGEELTLDRHYLGTARVTSHGTDPYILLTTDALEPARIQVVRFNLWCSTPLAAHAQLYWRHEGAAAFDEEHSIIIPLNGAAAAWQEYVGRFDASAHARAWYDGGPIVALRFDPIDVPGPVGLGELALCHAGA
jgi:GT2 family glycosyltransferase/glycosyltransferase involved in cell wall biosynthesis